eukprot:7406711-Pyramimonas_sp.AAC.1
MPRWGACLLGLFLQLPGSGVSAAVAARLRSSRYPGCGAGIRCGCTLKKHLWNPYTTSARELGLRVRLGWSDR